MTKRKKTKLKRKDEKPRVELLTRYPLYLRRGMAPTSQLVREEGFRGSADLPPGPLRTYTKEERDAYEKEMRDRGDLE